MLTYLANSIEAGGKSIPYSTVTALSGAPELTLTGGSPAPALTGDEIYLNDWAARDLGAKPGDAVEMSYYVVGPGGALETERHGAAGQSRRRTILRKPDKQRDGADKFARGITREEFGRFYWDEDMAAAMSRQEAAAARRLAEARALWKRTASTKAKLARQELRRKIRLAKKARSKRDAGSKTE